MASLVERLREQVIGPDSIGITSSLLRKAADRIEDLEVRESTYRSTINMLTKSTDTVDALDKLFGDRESIR